MTITDITPANITLDSSGTPYALDYGDCYFSRENGLAETHYVFLEGNQLPQRWQRQKRFVIAETGFGTGLNFLTTWQAWQADPQHCTQLHFISIEKHPIPRQQLATLLTGWPALIPFVDALLHQYPPLVSGIHRLYFAQGQVVLSLYFMDIATALTELATQVDCWYLDGFSPDRNTSMWELGIMQQIAQHSHYGATLATFTAAGFVKRHLQTAGFTVQKRKGFGKKREMLTASLNSSLPTTLATPWFSTPKSAYNERTATVIGAGIAGCQIAYALAKRGWQVTIIERHANPAMEASGNRAGVISPKMTAQPSDGELFYRQAFLTVLQQLQTLQQQHSIAWHPCGAMQLNHNQREQQRWHALTKRHLDPQFIQLLNAAQASEKAGITLPYGASYFPNGGYIYPKSFCHALLQHPNIRYVFNTHVLSLTTLKSMAWQIRNPQQQIINQSEILILANGKDATQFQQSAFLPLQSILGQTTHAKASAASRALQVTLGHEGYLTPSWQGEHVFGATFERNTDNFHINPQSDNINKQQLNTYLHEFAQQLPHYYSGHAAFRAVTPDRYPYVGAIPDLAFYQLAYADIKHGRQQQIFPCANYQHGLYLFAGFGSRGLTTTALCAEILACEIHQEPLPIQDSLRKALLPARYIIRQLSRT